MFPPSSRINNFSYSSQIMFNQPSTNEENPNPNPNPSPIPSSFFFPFSNPLFSQNCDSLNTHFVSQSLRGFDKHNSTVTGKEKPLKTRRKRKVHDGDNPNPNPNPRKRTGKSDRHSKIFTAQGPRDRRMRLSVHIARKFFDLQDMLGFDKASKTIEWLFSQSRDAIRELALANDSQMIINQSSLSNCENGFRNCFKLGEINDGSLGKQEYISQAKETRDKARARARERTREKMIIGKPEISKGVGTFEGNPNFEELGFLGSYDQEAAFPLQEVLMIDNFMGAASSSASNSIFDFDKDFSMSGGVELSNGFMGIFGNWDMMVPLTGNVVLEQSPIQTPLFNSGLIFNEIICNPLGGSKEH